MDNTLKFKNYTFNSRLILGTGGAKDLDLLRQAIIASKTELVTVALRRVGFGEGKGLLGIIKELSVSILPNTAGCFTAKDAIITAKLARDLFETNLVKLEIIGDQTTLLPDSIELLRAVEELANQDFCVLPYCSDDVISARRIYNAGAAAIMPLGSPIGSGLGISNPNAISLITREMGDKVPVILDAGIGTASDATLAMELGCDGVLVASAITRSSDPLRMANAIRLAVEAGFEARQAGRIPKRFEAIPSTPQQGLPEFS